VVSSDNAEMCEIARELGALSDARPPELGGDRVRFVEVLAEFLLRPTNTNRFRDVAVLLPTCPFRTADDVRAAFALRATQPDAFVVTISAYEFPPDFACDFDAATGALHLRQPAVYARSTQSQSVPPAFHPNGSIYLGSVGRFLATRTFFAEPLLGSLIPPERSLDLDHLYQWEITEHLAKTRLKP
jgi:N-acylneuraminate cytidylyltransferase